MKDIKVDYLLRNEAAFQAFADAWEDQYQIFEYGKPTWQACEQVCEEEVNELKKKNSELLDCYNKLAKEIVLLKLENETLRNIHVVLNQSVDKIEFTTTITKDGVEFKND